MANIRRLNGKPEGLCFIHRIHLSMFCPMCGASCSYMHLERRSFPPSRSDKSCSVHPNGQLVFCYFFCDEYCCFSYCCCCCFCYLRDSFDQLKKKNELCYQWKEFGLHSKFLCTNTILLNSWNVLQLHALKLFTMKTGEFVYKWNNLYIIIITI